MMMSPTAARCSSQAEINQRRSSLGWSSKTRTLRSLARSSSGVDRAGLSVMGVLLYGSDGSLDLSQILMHKLNDNSAFAYTRSDALDRSVTHVIYNKNSGHAGFEQAGISGERPRLGLLAIVDQVRPGKNEAPVVAFDGVAKPC